MGKTTKKPAKTPKQVEADTIAKAEAKLQAKYGDKVVEGSVRRAPAKSKYAGKLLCKIRTVGIDGKRDGKTREIATSDVFQVHHTTEVAAELRKLRAKEKRAAAKAKRTGGSVEDAAKKLGV